MAAASAAGAGTKEPLCTAGAGGGSFTEDAPVDAKAVRGRVLDLSTGAARAIGLTGAGVGRVTAEVVS